MHRVTMPISDCIVQAQAIMILSQNQSLHMTDILKDNSWQNS